LGEEIMKILLCTDGSKTALKAANLLVRMNLLEQLQLTLLGSLEEKSPEDHIQKSFEQIEDALGCARPGWKRVVMRGSYVKNIEHLARSEKFDLVALGEDTRHHRGLWLLKSQSMGKHLSKKLETPFLIARDVPGEVRRVLFCSSAKDPSDLTLCLGGNLIARTGARISVLHVMSQIALVFTPSEADLLDTAETAIKRKTLEGEYLLRAISVLRQSGLQAEITPILRHGLVIDEILCEIRQGGYDLLVIGAHHRPGYDPKLERLAEDVATDLISEVPCSIMVI
jgi:nucleotide-binding universal stress UspA family protein